MRKWYKRTAIQENIWKILAHFLMRVQVDSTCMVIDDAKQDFIPRGFLYSCVPSLEQVMLGLALWCSEWSLHLWCWHPLRMLVDALTVSLPFQPTGNGQALGPLPPTQGAYRVLLAQGSGLWTSPAQATLSTWGTNQKTDGLSVFSPSVSHSDFQIHK